MIKDWVNPFSSFLALILIFVTVIVLTTIAALYSISRHLEQRLAGVVAEHIKAISVSVDLAQRSFPSGEYIHDLLREDGRITVGMEENHIIHKIVVVDADNRVIDSADSSDIGKTSKDVLGGLMPSSPADARPAADANGREPELALTYPIVTDQGRRNIVIIRLNRMVSDFLSCGRPARIKLREANARGLIEEVMSLVRARADQQGVSLSVEEKASDNGAAGDVHFKGDAEQLKTCFSNLAINAVQAMAGGGALKVTLRPHQNNIRFEVADTGQGIAPEALGQIFEPYFSTKETGIGLGLALTRKLIEDHGGQIMVSSEVGVGTTFTVILPREPVAIPQAASLSQAAPQFG